MLDAPVSHPYLGRQAGGDVRVMGDDDQGRAGLVQLKFNTETEVEA